MKYHQHPLKSFGDIDWIRDVSQKYSNTREIRLETFSPQEEELPVAKECTAATGAGLWNSIHTQTEEVI